MFLLKSILAIRGYHTPPPAGKGKVVGIAALSRGRRNEFSFTVGSEGEASPDILRSQVREVTEDFFFAHARSEVFQDIVYRHAQTTNTWLAATLLGINRNTVFPIHRSKLIRQPWNDQATAS